MFSQSLINKKIDLAANDGLSVYNGHAAQQHHNVFEVMYNFYDKVKPKNVLEIGTALGGFTRVVY
jgi:predicted O-methyltransferase YrrM